MPVVFGKKPLWADTDFNLLFGHNTIQAPTLPAVLGRYWGCQMKRIILNIFGIFIPFCLWVAGLVFAVGGFLGAIQNGYGWSLVMTISATLVIALTLAFIKAILWIEQL
jgi:hypothetical protein